MSSRSKATKESTSALLAEMPASTQGGRTYSIGDLSREFGVTLRTLRFYEDRGLLSPRREGMVRIYDARDRARLSVILKGKQLGFTLAEIEGMLAMENQGEMPAATLKLSVSQIDDQIAHLERQRDEIDQAIAELRDKQAQIGADQPAAARG